jgi:ankyrin repeat-rich membrane spanning protein
LVPSSFVLKTLSGWQIVDGLDSVEQRKILTVLDTVHSLFSDPGLPFIIILAIDPHVIIKVLYYGLNRCLKEH